MGDAIKPLGRNAYGRIGCFPQSRLGRGDFCVSTRMAAVCLEEMRDRKGRIIVQEKLDGSCVCVAKIDGELFPMIRAGWPAISSKRFQHHLFDAWVREQHDRFDSLLQDGERLAGEWLALAHGTRYDLAGREPFVAFDLLRGANYRLSFDEFERRVAKANNPLGFEVPAMLYQGTCAMPIEGAIEALQSHGHYGAIDPAEGVVYRVEHKDQASFLVKFLLPNKVDGRYLPENNDGQELWNWLPEPVAVEAQESAK